MVPICELEEKIEEKDAMLILKHLMVYCFIRKQRLQDWTGFVLMKGIIFNPKRTTARESDGVGSGGGAAEWGAAARSLLPLSLPRDLFFPSADVAARWLPSPSASAVDFTSMHSGLRNCHVSSWVRSDQFYKRLG